jgi:hypothetical protein
MLRQVTQALVRTRLIFAAPAPKITGETGVRGGLVFSPSEGEDDLDRR